MHLQNRVLSSCWKKKKKERERSLWPDMEWWVSGHRVSVKKYKYIKSIRAKGGYKTIYTHLFICAKKYKKEQSETNETDYLQK